MRKVVAVVMFGSALVLGIVGVIGLVAVDGDGVLRAPTTTVQLGDAVGVRSTPGVLALDRATVVVEARSPQGALVGAAHPVDARAWLAGRATRAVTKVDTSGATIGAPSPMAGGSPFEKAGVSAEVPPMTEVARLEFWDEVTVGPGWQRLDLARDGSPISYLILPDAPGANVEVRHGVLLPWLRPTAWGLLALGVVLMVLAGWRFRSRAKRVERQASTAPDPSTREVSAADDRAHQRRATVLAGGLCLTLSLSGCAGVPQPVRAWDEATVTKQALAAHEVEALLKSYDERNNKAIVDTATSGEPSAWEVADAWALLDVDTLSTRLRRVADQGETTPGQHVGHTSYAPGFSGYPMWAFVPVNVRFGDRDPANTLALFTKDSVSAPWRQAARSWMVDPALPRPITGAAATPTAQDVARAVDVAKDVRSVMAGQSGTVALVGGLSNIGKHRQDAVGDAAELATAATFYRGTDDDQLTGQASVHVVKAQGDQLLVMATYTHTSTLTAREGRSFSFQNEAYAKALAKEGQLQSVMLRAVCSAVLVVDRNGTSTMAGSSCDDVI